MIDKEALRLGESYIKSQLGNLNDLPRELSNTIANVYYKSACSLIEAIEMEKKEFAIPKSILNEMKKGVESGELLRKYMEKQAQIATDVKAACDFIQSLRKIDRTKKPNSYHYWVEFIIDCLKYNIKNATQKSEVQRLSERNTKLVVEVSNLIDLMRFNEKKNVNDSSTTMGKRMSAMVFSLCNDNKTEKFIKTNQFGNTETDRFNFCLLFFNTANVIFWVNYAEHPKAQDILDVMLKEITTKIGNDERDIRVGDYIVNENEMKLFDSEANENTKTTLYTIFNCLYDERINHYKYAIFQQMELAFKARESKNNKEFFGLDPMGKLFVYHFTGEEFKKQPKLYISVSALLATYSQVIANGVDEILKGNL